MIDVVVVGAGPSGMALAILLLEAGRSVRVLESRTAIGEHSRAIGIHPPGLAVLDRLGVGAAALEAGVPITRGVGISRGRVVAELGFGSIPAGHRFVLSLPQNQTVALLRERLEALDPSALLVGHEFTAFAAHPGFHDVEADEAGGGRTRLRCRFVVGADGTRSAVRRAARLPFRGRDLPDRYLMGDYPDRTGLGPVAVLFLHGHGITESFPLPGNRRRWVARLRDSGTASLPELIAQRTGHRVEGGENTMLSEFGTANFAVGSMNHPNLLLIGDAAHEVSPIGGQGMTLGLLDAAELAPVLDAALGGRLPRERIEEQLAGVSRRRLAAARRAARQARVNMALGRPLGGPAAAARDALAHALFASDRFSAAVAATFTMTGPGSGGWPAGEGPG
ncbi:FAD-dependent monooxygenase [Paeniglutamicibacter sp. ABSL32-1]|uniref:FAD-dependent oxidoreductase n=1 Tax=Paeniglutamicibacter quisquiliarum TaxID=2849498 RepID=UPI001C2D7CAE|nr:NAD(P)/FAD-dependent oxidoreductase [Paeniglutamicibacter quisquiliarum]MBV1779021.1 FAD-dependent monooxygenase [Paeniglutamicibacter quisquiliarum]